jgi:hypothetical protein
LTSITIFDSLDDMEPPPLWSPPFRQQLKGFGAVDLRVRLAEVGGRLEILALCVTPVKQGRRVDGPLLRQLRLGELTRRAAQWRADSDPAQAEAAPPLGLVEGVRGPVVAPAKAEAARRRFIREAARARGSLRLVAAAEIYQRAWRRGDAAPTKAVEKELGITYPAAVSLVRRCRAAALLPPTQQGRAGAEPAPSTRES